MEQPTPTQNVQELIDRYNRELLDLHKRQQVAVPAAAAPVRPQPHPTAESFEEPDVQRDLTALRAQPSAQQPEEAVPTYPYTDEDLNGEVPRPEDPVAPPATGPEPFTGYLRVYVFSGNGAEPLEGARVAVSRRQGDSDVLFANVATDRDGFTPVIPLPSVNPELTMRPDIPNPFVPYNIRVEAVGFISSAYENVPVYGNTYVTQPAAMVPLVAVGNNETRQFESGGPANL